MRKLTWMLGILVLSNACARRTEGLADASIPPQERALDAGAGAPPTVAEVDAGVAAGEDAGAALQQEAGVAAGADGGLARAPLQGPARDREEACVDRWLTARRLDRYGNPEGTMYAGGTPLFNEATGERIDRLAFVYQRQPEARAACAPGSHPPAPRAPTTK
jgi:hypothetical protein